MAGCLSAGPVSTRVFSMKRSGEHTSEIPAHPYLPSFPTRRSSYLGLRWGTANALNDLYFGLYGGLFIGGADQHAVFRNELRTIARYVKTSADRPPVPWSVSADGLHPRFNMDPGYDLDRCAMLVLQVVRAYE